MLVLSGDTRGIWVLKSSDNAIVFVRRHTFYELFELLGIELELVIAISKFSLLHIEKFVELYVRRRD